MNTVIENWVAALRSGEFAQTDSHLKNAEGYCCLGVLCELYAETHPESFWDEEDECSLFFVDQDEEVGAREFLPEKVQAWSGLKTEDAVIAAGNGSLATMNDTGKSFNEIADVIEDNPGLY